eukprot:scaffold1966_cov109-Cylindrotheca_fusiformis.AAC.5
MTIIATIEKLWFPLQEDIERCYYCFEFETMGNEASAPNHAVGTTTRPTASSHPRAHEISSLINFAQSNFEEHPTDALSALMQAMTLNSGQAKADQAMDRIRNELGPDIAGHVMDRHGRMQRAAQIVQELLEDESTLLYQRGKQHILQQAMEDGSSLVCIKCNGMIPVARWQQHANVWCEFAGNTTNMAAAAAEDSGEHDNDDVMMTTW